MAFQVEEELGAVIVLPGTRVYSPATQADNHRQMLNADRTLIFARATGSALKDGLLRNRCAEDGRLVFVSILVQVGAHSECDQFRVQLLAGVVGRAMFSASAALDA